MTRTKISFIGLSITALLIIFIFAYNIAKQNDPTKDTSKLAKHFIQDVKINLTTYKVIHGYYPESLDALKQVNDAVLILDPFVSMNKSKEKTVNLHYQKVSDTFEFFSVGPDKTPGTNDDIY